MKSWIILLFCIMFTLFSCKSITKEQVSMPEINKSITNLKLSDCMEPNVFSFAVIPDTQYYVYVMHQNFHNKFCPINQWEIFYRQTQFIANNSIKNGGPFSFALHVGDFVESRSFWKIEWELASKCMDNMDNELPFLAVPGNHDYDHWTIGKQIYGSKKYNEYFGPDSYFFKGKDWYKGSSGEGRNSWAIFEGAGRQFIVIGLEEEPSEKSVQWAQTIIDNNPHLPVIILTHEYLRSKQEIDLTDNSIDPNEYIPNTNFQFCASNNRRSKNGLLPEKLWNTFISKNNQIFLVICGHAGSKTRGTAYRADINKDGYTTYSIMSDFQYFKNYYEMMGIKAKKKRYCGDGWMNIIKIDFDKNNIHLSTYNTETGDVMNEEPYNMDFPINWDWDERF